MGLARLRHHRRWWLPLVTLLLSPATLCLPAYAEGIPKQATGDDFYDGRHNGLSSLPEDVPLSTKTLYLSYNDLSILGDKSFSTLKSLAHLDLAFNAITKISPKAFLETRLTSIDLCWNKLTSFPDLRAAHSTLEYLDLCRNQLEEVPAWAFQGLRLKSLDLSNNHITAFPDMSLVADTLSVIDLTNNPITSVPPKAFNELVSLERLYMENCKLTSFPDFSYLPVPNSLREIHLSRNQISFFPPKASQTLSSVTELFLGYNQLSVLPSGALYGMTSLDSLDLSQNQFQSLPDLVHVNRTLSFLDLSNNDLSQLPEMAIPKLLANMGQLDYLVLKNARLRLLGDVRETMGSRELHLDLNSNTDLVCDCRLSWLKVSGLAKDLTSGSKVCGQPTELRPKRWGDITQEMLCKGPNIEVKLEEVPPNAQSQPLVFEPQPVPLQMEEKNDARPESHTDNDVAEKEEDENDDEEDMKDDDNQMSKTGAFHTATLILNRDTEWTVLVSDHLTVVAVVSAGMFLWLAIAVYVCCSMRRSKLTAVAKSPLLLQEPIGAAQFVYKNEACTPVQKLNHDT